MAGAGMTGAGTAAGDAVLGSGWAGILGSFYSGGSAPPNINNFADSHLELTDIPRNLVNKARSGEDIDDQPDKIDQLENNNFEYSTEDPTDFLTFSDELMEEMTDKGGKKPTSIWPPRRT